jgi:2-polyprenyl-3-methyl-5-hydroxy-6-metoxy-1,4-benzoquinol methylase
MNSTRLQHIRKEERKYHEDCFENHRLYGSDSWLSEPVDLVMDYADKLEVKNEVRMLDLGCGVGRHSIPLAQKIRERGGEIICVDLLAKALEKLNEYSERYGVADTIQTEQSDISDYRIEPESFDYIVAGSSLEHVRSEELLNKVLKAMAGGTRAQGIVCIIMNTNIGEFNKADGSRRETLFEVIMDKDKALSLFRSQFGEWEMLHTGEEPLELEINRGEDPVLLRAISLSFIVRKP